MTDFYSLTQPGRPLVIAHKGHSSILPENTTEAIILALHYADLAELDVMLTYDREMVVFHDNFLSRMTNVADCPEFAHKKRQGKDQFLVFSDWWISDFTLEQLKKLKLKQGQLPLKRPNLWNWVYKIPTLKEFLSAILEFKQINQNRNSGLMIELKQQQGMKSQQIVIPFVRLIKELKISSIEECKAANLPIYLGSFTTQILEQVHKQTNLPLFQLLEQWQTCDVDQIAKFCIGMGIAQKPLYQSDFKCIEQYHRKNLSVIFWTIRIDKFPVPFGYQNYEQAQMRLIKQGIDGIITQFPQATQTVIKMMKYTK